MPKLFPDPARYKPVKGQPRGTPLTPWQHFELGAKRLITEELPLPAPLSAALGGTPCPLARGTVDALPDWMRRNGYGAQQRATLTRALGALAISEPYLRAIAAGTPRITLDGERDGRVTEAEAALTAFVLGDAVEPA